MASFNRYCPQCGAPVAAGQGFCSNCGATMDMNMAHPTARTPEGNMPPPPPAAIVYASATNGLSAVSAINARRYAIGTRLWNTTTACACSHVSRCCCAVIREAAKRFFKECARTDWLWYACGYPADRRSLCGSKLCWLQVYLISWQYVKHKHEHGDQ